ncbi:MAG: CerR family C-terminal domain-containing protein [Desulfobacteraceae bacterium]|jgi:AcrR family transcriptional regulator
MKTQTAWDDGTKKRLIEAAGEVFAQSGYRSATVREICKRANASVSAVNYHFKDKEGLYSAVFEYAHRLATEKYPHDWGLGPGATPEERLRVFIRSLLLRGLGGGFPAWHEKLVTAEISDPSGIFSKVAESSIRPMHGLLEEIVRELLKKNNPFGEADDETIRICSMNVVGQCIFQHHARQLMVFEISKNMKPEEIVAISEKIFRFSIAGIRAIASDTHC